EVAGLDTVQPTADLTIVQRLQPARQTERLVVGQIDRLVEVRRAHEAEHRTEALRAMEEGAAAHPQLDARRPERSLAVEPVRLQQPLLALLERGERAGQRAAGRLGGRGHAAR